MQTIILILLTITSIGATELSPQYLNAIHQVESAGRYGPIKGKKGELGPLQIRFAYWKDSGVSGDYHSCSNYSYSVSVVTAYANRFEPKAVKNNNFEVLARLHNGGPSWRKHKKATDDYWEKVKKHLDKE